MEFSTVATVMIAGLFLIVAGAAVGVVITRVMGRRSDEMDEPANPVADTLSLLNDRLSSMERQGAADQAQLQQQVVAISEAGVELRRQTNALNYALVRPEVRGNWGEMQLRRCLELAGLTSHCSFEEQPTIHTDDGTIRPDVVVNLPDDKFIVVDSKVSLDAFLSANQRVSPEIGEDHLRAHARQVKNHIDGLATKKYWEQFPTSPEFVVMFIPTEAGFSAALETDPGLIDHAAAKQVMLATPTTLIAMLRTVAATWTQEAMAENVREVQRLGRELHDRLAIFAKHLDRLGGSMATATGHYNSAIGSLENRVLGTVREMGNLGVIDVDLPTPRLVKEEVRSLDVRTLGSRAPEDKDQPRRRVMGE